MSICLVIVGYFKIRSIKFNRLWVKITDCQSIKRKNNSSPTLRRTDIGRYFQIKFVPLHHIEDEMTDDFFFFVQ